jgi:hypothetical protein
MTLLPSSASRAPISVTMRRQRRLVVAIEERDDLGIDDAG